MLSKAKIKYLNSLKSKKFRQKYNNFMAEGDKVAKEIITLANELDAQKWLQIEAIFALPQWIDENQVLLKPFQNILTEVDLSELKKISNFQTPNQVLIVVKQFTYNLNNEVLNSNLTLILDEIQDPGNLGTILRIADWFGIPNVIGSLNCADFYNPKTVQASMGAILRIKYFKKDLIPFLNKRIHIPSYGALLGGENLFKTQLSKTAFIVIGNEGKGISEEVQKHLKHQIEIPSSGGAESLNAAVATGIICAAFRNL
jgi:TrmH family RNA methyltransferase